MKALEIVAINGLDRTSHDEATAVWLETATEAEAAAFARFQASGCPSRCAMVSAACVCWPVALRRLMR